MVWDAISPSRKAPLELQRAVGAARERASSEQQYAAVEQGGLVFDELRPVRLDRGAVRPRECPSGTFEPEVEFGHLDDASRRRHRSSALTDTITADPPIEAERKRSRTWNPRTMRASIAS